MLPKRKITRLPHYDYRLNGAYFVTICTFHRRPAFARIRDDATVHLHPFGHIAHAGNTILVTT